MVALSKGINCQLWEKYPDAPIARESHTIHYMVLTSKVVIVINLYVLIKTSSEIMYFMFHTDTIQDTIAEEPVERRLSHRLQEFNVATEHVLVAIGGEESTRTPSNQVWIFSLSRRAWRQHPSLSAPLGRSRHVSFVTPVNTIAMTGGILNKDGNMEDYVRMWEYNVVIDNICVESGLEGCSGRGTCYQLSDLPNCICDVGYSGEKCDECDSINGYERNIFVNVPSHEQPCNKRGEWKISRGLASFFGVIAVLGILMCISFGFYMAYLKKKGSHSILRR